MITSNVPTWIEDCNNKLSLIEISIEKIQKGILKEITLTNDAMIKELTSCQNKLIIIESVLKEQKSVLEKYGTKKEKGSADVEIGEIIKKFSNCQDIIKDLRADVCRAALPDEMEQLCISNDRLNNRMKEVCEDTVDIFSEYCVGNHYDAETVKRNFLHLYASHKEGKKLLKQMQANLHIENDAVAKIFRFIKD